MTWTRELERRQKPGRWSPGGWRSCGEREEEEKKERKKERDKKGIKHQYTRKEARISTSGGGFSTAHEDGNTEVSMRDSYTEQIQTLKRQVDELTARLEATLTAEGG